MDRDRLRFQGLVKFVGNARSNLTRTDERKINVAVATQGHEADDFAILNSNKNGLRLQAFQPGRTVWNLWCPGVSLRRVIMSNTPQLDGVKKDGSRYDCIILVKGANANCFRGFAQSIHR